MLAGLCARAASGGGQYVTTSLLGAGLLLHSVVFERDGEVVSGPGLDAAQTGYGPGYRLYAGADGRWLALVLPDEVVWRRLTSLPELASLPAEYAPLRGFLDGALDAAARQAETVLEEAFATAVLDDPVNRQLGRVVSFPTADWGRFEQIGPLLRCGPEDFAGPRLMLPGVGEHTVEILGELGFTAAEIDALLAAKVARQLEPGA
jgi:crotonobetainyl-CoA:carnitine CoA-transferase CaiB-like acyl-CoA transferase